MQKELWGVMKPQEALKCRIRKQQNQRGNVGKCQESVVSYKTLLNYLGITYNQLLGLLKNIHDPISKCDILAQYIPINVFK